MSENKKDFEFTPKQFDFILMLKEYFAAQAKFSKHNSDYTKFEVKL